MKKIGLLLLTLFICIFGVSCVIETPEEHFNSPKNGEPTGTYAKISVTCETVLDNLDKAGDALLPFIPSDGVILPQTRVEIMRNDSALKLLTDTLKQNGILYTAGKLYIYSINHLDEKAFGAESGWVYYVNGVFSGIGPASYTVKENDVIEWRYSCVKGDLAEIE